MCTITTASRRHIEYVCYHKRVYRMHVGYHDKVAMHLQAIHKALGAYSLTSVRYGAGRGGFSLARPRPYTQPGGVFLG